MLTTELTPAMKFYLMVGTHSEARVRGWARAAQDDPTPDTVWAVYCDVLIAEAAAAGFTPWRVSKVPPTGAGFEAWRARFLKTFGY